MTSRWRQYTGQEPPQGNGPLIAWTLLIAVFIIGMLEWNWHR